MDVHLVGDARETLRALLPLLEHKTDRAWQEQIEDDVDGLVGADGAPRARGRRPDQPAARLLGALAAPARTAASSPPTPARPRTGSRATSGCASGMMALALGHARDDGARRAVRDRRQVRAPRPAGDRARRRRRDADERPQRADHGRQVLAALERPAARRARAQQPRPEPGHVGAARAPGRPDVPGARRRSPTSPTRRFAELVGLHGIRVDDPDRSARPGTTRSPPTGPACSRRSSTRRCRRCRRTSRFEQAKHFTQALSATPTRGR